MFCRALGCWVVRAVCPPAAGPLEDYAACFDELFSRLAQRTGFRDYLTGLLAPRDRNKTLTGLAGAEPVAGTQHAAVQRLQYFLSQSTWDADEINRRAAGVVGERPSDRAARSWRDRDRRLRRPQGRHRNGARGAAVAGLLRQDRQRHRHALAAGVVCRAVVADSFYGEHDDLRGAREQRRPSCRIRSRGSDRRPITPSCRDGSARCCTDQARRSRVGAHQRVARRLRVRLLRTISRGGQTVDRRSSSACADAVRAIRSRRPVAAAISN